MRHPSISRARLLTASVTAAVALWLLAGLPAARAEGTDKALVVAVDKVGATQEQVGHAIALESRRWMLKDAPDTGRAKYVREVVAPGALSKPFRAIIDPQGVPRILDGHHRAYALAQIQAEYGVEIKVRLEIAKDYRGWSQRRYARHLTKVLGVGQFSPATRKRYPARSKRSAELRVAKLPRSILKCTDSPLRSTIGAALWYNGIDGDHFVDYLEFVLSDRLRRDPRVPTSARKLGGRELSRGAVKPIAAAIFGPHSSYLGSLARPQHKETVRATIKKVVRRRPRASRPRTWGW